MKILVSGSNGLVGSALVRRLTGGGHYVVRLVRRDPDRSRGDLLWDPAAGKIERAGMENLDAVVHLAGESILGLWTRAKKQRIHQSRVQATGFLMEALAGLNQRPRAIVSASAIGYYGHRGDQWLPESSGPGQGFLPMLCQEWEKAAQIAARAGIRVVNLRIGLVLGAGGGVLKSMAPLFRAGLGGKLGGGGQMMSWIELDDLARAIQFCVEREDISGPVNGVSPNPVSNSEFTRALAAALGRPALLPVPAALLRLLPGGMGAEAFLASQRVEPARLRKAGFEFSYPALDGALRHALAIP